MTIFIDSDVILDLLLKRADYQAAQNLFNLIEIGQVTAYTSPVVLTNIFYLISKIKDKELALKAVTDLNQLLKISPINKKTVRQTLSSSFTDFEDGLQHFSAMSVKADYVISRNLKDYQESQIKVANAATFLQIIE